MARIWSLESPEGRSRVVVGDGREEYAVRVATDQADLEPLPIRPSRSGSFHYRTPSLSAKVAPRTLLIDLIRSLI